MAAANHDELLPLVDALALCCEPMFAINERHRVIFWNKPLERFLGWTYDDVVGRPCSQVLCGTDAFGNRYCTDPCPVVAICQRGESVRHFNLAVRAKTGESTLVDIAALKFTLPQSKRSVIAHIIHPAAAAITAAPPQPLVASSHIDARVRELTTREIEVLGMMAGGQSATDIARELGIAPLTARNHIQHILEKLELHSKTEAVAFAYRMRLV